MEVGEAMRLNTIIMRRYKEIFGDTAKRNSANFASRLHYQMALMQMTENTATPTRNTIRNCNFAQATATVSPSSTIRRNARSTAAPGTPTSRLLPALTTITTVSSPKSGTNGGRPTAILEFRKAVPPGRRLPREYSLDAKVQLAEETKSVVVCPGAVGKKAGKKQKGQSRSRANITETTTIDSAELCSPFHYHSPILLRPEDSERVLRLGSFALANRRGKSKPK